MAEQKNLVSQPPLTTPLANPDGSINRTWAIWFRDLYRRTAFKGGNAIDENKAETDQSLLEVDSNIEAVVEAVNENEVTMNNHIDAETAHGSNGKVIGADDTATELVAGLVKLMALVADAVDATESTVSVDSPDATTAPAAYDQTQIESIVTLANETAGDVNQLVTDLNAVVIQLNELITNSKTAGQMNV